MTPNTAALNELASDFAADYATATLKMFDASNNELVSQTLAGFGAPANGLLTANAIAPATVLPAAGAGTAIDYAELTAGGLTYTLTVTTTGGGGDVEIDNTTVVANGTFNITGLSVQF